MAEQRKESEKTYNISITHTELVLLILMMKMGWDENGYLLDEKQYQALFSKLFQLSLDE